MLKFLSATTRGSLKSTDLEVEWTCVLGATLSNPRSLGIQGFLLEQRDRTLLFGEKHSARAGPASGALHSEGYMLGRNSTSHFEILSNS